MTDFGGIYIKAIRAMPWEVLDLLTAELGRPTEGYIAEAIFYKGNYGPDADGFVDAMKRMGYQAYVDYPLLIEGDRAPADKARFLALEAAKQEIEENGLYLERVAVLMAGNEGVADA